MFEIVEAKREKAPITAAFLGESGAGKTYSALLFARGLVEKDGKIVIIDTEGSRSKIYANDSDIGKFYHIDLTPPYSSARFLEAFKNAVDFGADAVIVDSQSHEYEGIGGVLDYAEMQEKNGARGFQKWTRPKMDHNKYKRYAISAPCHVVFCIREKSTIDPANPKGENVVVPVCDKNFLFDMTIVARIDRDHNVTFTKVPKPLEACVKNGAPITLKNGQMLAQESGGGDDDAEFKKAVHVLDDIATLGLVALQKHWETLDRDMKVRLKPLMDSRFKPMAEEVDSINAQPTEATQPTF